MHGRSCPPDVPRLILAFVLACSASASALGFAAGHPADEWHRVRLVIDGDTFDTTRGERVRLIGVDAPEYRPWEGVVEPYGKEAGQFLRSHLAGKRVRLGRDRSDRDRYGRSLRYVYDTRGEMVNARIIREGLAEAKMYPPDTAFQKELRAAEAEARSARRGLWSDAKTRKQTR